MKSKHQFRRALFERFEERQLMTAAPNSVDLADISVTQVASNFVDHHHHQHSGNHDGHEHGNHGLGCSCGSCLGALDSIWRYAAESDGAASGWDSGSPQDITHVVTIQPVIVSNSDGSNTAEYFGSSTEEAIIHDLIDQIWAQAGIDIDWLAPNYWNDTFANVGNGSASNSRPTSDLGTIRSSGDAAGVGNTDPLVLDMYFVEISAGFTQLGNNYANGLAYVGANGSTVHVGDSLVSWSGGRETVARVVAHEIGHNLGLGHVVDTPNLMDDGELLNNSQISTSLSSQFSVELPENFAPVVASPIADVFVKSGSTPQTLDLAGIFYDANGDTLTYNVSTSDSATANGTLNGSQLGLTFNGLGQATITVTASDNRGASVSENILVTVENTVFSGDFDGDGVDDLITWSNGSWEVVLSPAGNSNASSIGTWANSVVWEDLGVGDFNADGRTDVVGRTGGQWWVGLSDGSTLSSQWWGGWSTAVEWLDVDYGDFDGDGRDDIIGRERGNWWLASSGGNNFSNAYWGSWSSVVDWEDVAAADFNGDGQLDVAGRTGGNWWVGISTGSSFSTSLWTSWSDAVDWQQVTFADFNGDGRADIAGRAGGNWWVAVSNGTSMQNQNWGYWSTAVSWFDVETGDFNGDGKQDIVGRTGGSWWLALGGDSSFTNALLTTQQSSIWRNNETGDYDGDGRIELHSQLDAELLIVGV
ncbi:MAG: FG-GAP-like repeat-containing protein [Aureliella sp.]